MRKGSANNNALQVSWAVPSAEAGSPVDPHHALRSWILGIGGVPEDVPPRYSGAGRVATLQFAAEDFAYCQAWCVVDGEQLINVSLVCDEPPTGNELQEVEQMVKSLKLVQGPPDRPRKWLWF